MSIFEAILSLFMPTQPVPTAPTPQIIYVEDKASKVNFAPLREQGIRNLSLSYFGFSGEVPEYAKVNWNHALEGLWNKKLDIENVSGATRNSVPDILSDFARADSQTMNIDEHISEVDELLNNVKRDMDWVGICLKYRLDGNQCRNFVSAAYNIDAKMLTAYSMTELMPYHNGDQNYALMSIYFENGGRRYLDVVPALGDTYLSMGRYQFTSFAIGSDDDGPRPVNQIAAYSTKYPVPGSVVKLNGIESDLAAYYFSVYNVMTLIKKMSDSNNARFKAHCISQKDQLVEYIATAHHNPTWARKRAIEWVREDCSKPLITYQGERLEIYSIKTATNYKAILQNI